MIISDLEGNFIITKRDSNFWQLLLLIKPYRLIFATALLASILYAGVDALLVKLMQPLIDDVFIAKKQAYINYIPLILPGILLARGLLGFISKYVIAWVSKKIILTMRIKLFAKMQRLPMHYLDTHNTGSLVTMLTYNVEMLSRSSSELVLITVEKSASVLFYLTTMFWTNWRLSLIFLLITPIVALLLRYSSTRLRRIARHIQNSMGDVSVVARENLDNYQLVRANNAGAFEIAKFSKACARIRSQEMKVVVTQSIFSPLVQFVLGLGASLIIYSVITHETFTLTAGEFTTITMALFMLMRPIKILSDMLERFNQGMAGAESVFAF